MNLIPIAELLDTANLGKLAISIFINQIPVDCINGVLIRNRLQGTPINYELPGYFKTTFQIIVRSTSYVAGEELMNEVTKALTVTETQIQEMYFKFMRPLTLPVVFPISKGNLLEFSADIEVAFVI